MTLPTYTRTIAEKDKKTGELVTVTETMVEFAPHRAVNLDAGRHFRLVPASFARKVAA